MCSLRSFIRRLIHSLIHTLYAPGIMIHDAVVRICQSLSAWSCAWLEMAELGRGPGTTS